MMMTRSKFRQFLLMSFQFRIISINKERSFSAWDEILAKIKQTMTHTTTNTMMIRSKFRKFLPKSFQFWIISTNREILFNACDEILAKLKQMNTVVLKKVLFEIAPSHRYNGWENDANSEILGEKFKSHKATMLLLWSQIRYCISSGGCRIDPSNESYFGLCTECDENRMTPWGVILFSQEVRNLIETWMIQKMDEKRIMLLIFYER